MPAIRYLNGLGQGCSNGPQVAKELGDPGHIAIGEFVSLQHLSLFIDDANNASLLVEIDADVLHEILLVWRVEGLNYLDATTVSRNSQYPLGLLS